MKEPAAPECDPRYLPPSGSHLSIPIAREMNVLFWVVSALVLPPLVHFPLIFGLVLSGEHAYLALDVWMVTAGANVLGCLPLVLRFRRNALNGLSVDLVGGRLRLVDGVISGEYAKAMFGLSLFGPLALYSKITDYPLNEITMSVEVSWIRRRTRRHILLDGACGLRTFDLFGDDDLDSAIAQLRTVLEPTRS